MATSTNVLPPLQLSEIQDLQAAEKWKIQKRMEQLHTSNRFNDKVKAVKVVT